jgi:SAM-dependent methyltransferase
MPNPPSLTDCAACGEPVARAVPHFPSIGLLRCARCGLVFADPVRWRIDPEAVYAESYFEGEEYADYRRDRKMLEANFRSLMRRVERWSRGGRLFEIGCAYGFFLNLARRRWDAQGIDVTEPGVRHAREELGLQARRGDFLEEPLPPESFDVFCLWDTLEHLARPDLYVEKISRSLKPGGFLFLTTGDIGSAVARRRGEKWRLIHPPTHLFYFDRPTVTRMLDRYGLEVVEIGSQGYTRSLDSMFRQLALRARGSTKGLLEKLGRFRPFQVPITLDLGDIMFVGARRRPRS